ncbi:MAG: OPT/YSL family transporter [Planctomycetes bacterium]|nr:OPT/YSL family transporter [Planctomycetota bacterium]
MGDPDRRGHVGAGDRPDDAGAERRGRALHEEGAPGRRGAGGAAGRADRKARPPLRLRGTARPERVPRRPRAGGGTREGETGPLPRDRGGEAGVPRRRADLPGREDDGQRAGRAEGVHRADPAAVRQHQGILNGTLEWSLIIAGALIAITLELCGVSALPVAVGMYLPLGASTPIFVGGMLRLVADRLRGGSKSEAESETSPGVLLSSGYIAGGTLCGLIIAFMAFVPEVQQAMNLGLHVFGEVNEQTGKKEWKPDEVGWSKVVSVVTFLLLGAYLLWVGSRKERPGEGGGGSDPPRM